MISLHTIAMINSINLIPVMPSDSIWSEFYNLYQVSFPLDERRSEQDLISMFDSPKFHPCIITLQNQFVGLFNYWDFEIFSYIEHFAVSPELRGRGIGKSIIHEFSESNTIILECEHPIDEISMRRLTFYESLGFQPFPYAYTQPPYSSEKNPLEMLLLTNSSQKDQSTFNKISSIIAISVYKYIK